MRTHRSGLLLLALTLLAAPAVHADDGNVERASAADAGIDVERGNPVTDPLSAWSAAREALPAGDRVRRLAFSPSGLFVFHSHADDARIFATFLQWQDDGLAIDPPELRDGMDCPAPAVDPADITPALRRLLEDAAWQQHRAKLDALVLECSRDTVYWMLLPVPDGGYQAGVPIPTFDVAFSPASGR